MDAKKRGETRSKKRDITAEATAPIPSGRETNQGAACAAWRPRRFRTRTAPSNSAAVQP